VFGSKRSTVRNRKFSNEVGPIDPMNGRICLPRYTKFFIEIDWLADAASRIEHQRCIGCVGYLKQMRSGPKGVTECAAKRSKVNSFMLNILCRYYDH
jgi:hypothetical protein